MSNFDPDSFEGRVLGDLATIKEKVRVIPEHGRRIDRLESTADKNAGSIRALSWIGGVGGITGLIAGIWHFLLGK